MYFSCKIYCSHDSLFISIIIMLEIKVSAPGSKDGSCMWMCMSRTHVGPTNNGCSNKGTVIVVEIHDGSAAGASSHSGSQAECGVSVGLAQKVKMSDVSVESEFISGNKHSGK